LFIYSKLVFTYFKCLYFSHFLNTRIWWGSCNQAVAPGITRSICMPLVITITDDDQEIELLWFEKLYVEMDFVWF